MFILEYFILFDGYKLFLKVLKVQNLSLIFIVLLYSNYISIMRMIFQLGWAALAAIFTFSIAMVVWGRNGDGSIDI